ncbi:binding-protein-dependent transport systems inner membrane component [Xylanimonas cellulosilytica DSM 15894]|uniref:Binding-protein-dependent transport systems inner membrane component n=1 Tax=Xylanimonas cellulosilytica (strain DSM 15894 / JCM 12276 / CECT 5975 / KCTC 9989 / LMG 20990 / NBRC 107835 / XIL07) TaxID=446471 RepID=D1BZ03_XYLCX|nr:carbohydrate ABC transporter permease [Xylanimonas cellulosilytica]ACZ30078.1 binding-protein-dependent transport systems inner membrane component [Xylanimonas cellulosilytica DSM 15894]
MSAVTTTPSTATRGTAATPRRRRWTGRRAGKWVLSLVALLLAAVWAFPVYWMVLSAFTPNARLRATTPNFLPTNATLRNFQRLLESDSNFWPALRMSLGVTFLTVFLVLLFAFLAALAVSRYRFKGRKSFILAVLFIQMLPAEGLFIAQYKMLASTGMLNRTLGISILYTAAVVPFTIWMLRGFVAGIPADLEEAAMVDGLSRTQAFLRITLPLLAPGLVASGVYAFLQAWNEFTIALVALPGQSSQTLPLWLRGFINASAARGVDWATVMAASTLLAIPVIIFFLFVQGRMTSGLVSGAVKG